MPIFTRPLHEVTDTRGNEHAPAGTAIGGQFVAKSGSGSSGGHVDVPAHSPALASGSVVKAVRQTGGVNTSLRVTLDDGTKAIYKPEVGEVWKGGFANGDIPRLLTNRQLSLAEREAMAWEVDQLLGTNLVPETVLREQLQPGEAAPGTGAGEDASGSGSGSDEEDDAPQYDEDELRQMYDDYRENNIDAAQNVVDENMGELFGEAQKEHVADVQARAEEINEIWNELIDEHPEYADNEEYGHRSALAEHPVLPLGSRGEFLRNPAGGEVDPLEVIDEANVDVSSSMNDSERGRVRDVLDRALQNGAQTLLDVDEDRAMESLDYSDWLEGHQDTENNILDRQFLDFDEWMADNGYDMPTSGASVALVAGGALGTFKVKNKQAPHPQGGSLQKVIGNLSHMGGMDMDSTLSFAVLDYAIGSMDRHGGNVLYTSGRPAAIDNGYSMPAANTGTTFRTGPVTDWLNQARYDPSQRETPAPLRAQLHDRVLQTDWNAWTARHPSMSADEKESFLERVGLLQYALGSPTGLYDLWKKQTIM